MRHLRIPLLQLGECQSGLKLLREKKAIFSVILLIVILATIVSIQTQPADNSFESGKLNQVVRFFQRVFQGSNPIEEWNMIPADAPRHPTGWFNRQGAIETELTPSKSVGEVVSARISFSWSMPGDGSRASCCQCGERPGVVAKVWVEDKFVGEKEQCCGSIGHYCMPPQYGGCRVASSYGQSFDVTSVVKAAFAQGKTSVKIKTELAGCASVESFRKFSIGYIPLTCQPGLVPIAGRCCIDANENGVCDDDECPPNQVLLGGRCCLDSNDNKICDDEECTSSWKCKDETTAAFQLENCEWAQTYPCMENERCEDGRCVPKYIPCPFGTTLIGERCCVDKNNNDVCDDEECPEGQVLIGEKCCYDLNNNGICDSEETRCPTGQKLIGARCCFDMNNNQICDEDEIVAWRIVEGECVIESGSDVKTGEYTYYRSEGECLEAAKEPFPVWIVGVIIAIGAILLALRKKGKI